MAQRQVNYIDAITSLTNRLTTSGDVLTYAQHMADAILPDATAHCAITLSSLLIFADIFPKAIYAGSKNLEPAAQTLATDLTTLGWTRIELGQPIQAGDVGVVWFDAGKHHIYLIIDATNQNAPTVADNQGAAHTRTIARSGDFSPTNFFLRAPDALVAMELTDTAFV